MLGYQGDALVELAGWGGPGLRAVPARSPIFDIDSQNINVNDRFDGWRTMYYSDLLGADRAYLRVSASLYVYARGGGSAAQLNSVTGVPNYLEVPWVYVD